jgi:hypothetical protein
MTFRECALPLAIALALIPGLALADGVHKVTADELHAAYCLGYLDASGPTSDQLRDPSAADALTQGILAQHKALRDRLTTYLESQKAPVGSPALQAESQHGVKDVAVLRGPSSVPPDKVMSDPTVQRVLSCVTLSWLPN